MTADQKLMRRAYRVMLRELICSEHGALCYIEACRRERAAKRKARVPSTRGVAK